MSPCCRMEWISGDGGLGCKKNLNTRREKLPSQFLYADSATWSPKSKIDYNFS